MDRRCTTSWRPDSLGTLAVGKVADLVLLEANPLEDITHVRRIAAVVLRGRLFEKKDLEELLASVAAAEDLRVNDWLRQTAR